MNIITKMTAAAIMLQLTVSCCKVTSIDVIPTPSKVKVSESIIPLTSLKTITATEGLENEAGFLASAFNAELTEKGGKVLLSTDSTLPEESYVLTARCGKVKICGGSPAAVFFGIQTLIQETEVYGGVRKGTVKDCPRFAWRGFMLDESRHFFGTEEVKTLLDFMARYKMNKFHWHLTDSPGWRIEIKAYPKLTEIGAVGCHTDANAPAQFYTQEQIKELVAYATARHIDVIPEIDMPGHGNSATRSYPELGVAEGSFTYNPGKEEVYAFFTDVLKEVCSLFPGKYVHIGGDEVFQGNQSWTADPYIEELIKKENLDGAKGAEAYFISRMTKTVNEMGKTVLAWDDMLELGLPGDSNLITWWRHDRMDHLYQGIKEDRSVILCPRLPLYYDFTQDKSHIIGRIWRDGSFCPIQDVYAFPEPLFEKWEDNDADYGKILGIQANLWSEMVKTSERMQFMTYPRICALAEAAWTLAENKNYEDFTRRLDAEYETLKNAGLYYFDNREPSSTPEPQI